MKIKKLLYMKKMIKQINKKINKYKIIFIKKMKLKILWWIKNI